MDDSHLSFASAGFLSSSYFCAFASSSTISKAGLSFIVLLLFIDLKSLFFPPMILLTFHVNHSSISYLTSLRILLSFSTTSLIMMQKVFRFIQRRSKNKCRILYCKWKSSVQNQEHKRLKKMEIQIYFYKWLYIIHLEATSREDLGHYSTVRMLFTDVCIIWVS